MNLLQILEEQRILINPWAKLPIMARDHQTAAAYAKQNQLSEHDWYYPTEPEHLAGYLWFHDEDRLPLLLVGDYWLHTNYQDLLEVAKASELRFTFVEEALT